MNWTQASVIVDRFVRLVDGNLNDLKQKHVLIKQYEREKDFERAAVEKSQSDRLIREIQNALQQVMTIRSELSESPKCQFDARIDPVRLRIQATLSAISSSREESIEEETPFKPTGKKSTNPFEEEDNLFDDCFQEEASTTKELFSDYEYQMQQQMQTHSKKDIEALRLRVEKAREDAEATKKLERDIECLNQITFDLAQIVHSQNEIVDSIEEQVERSAQEIEQGNRQLRQAVIKKQAKYPVVAAAVGSIAIGGPVGIFAGSIVAGVGAAIGGALAGIWGGNKIRQKTVEESTDK